VVHPGAAREHYDRLAGAHAQLWQLLRPTFRVLERGRRAVRSPDAEAARPDGCALADRRGDLRHPCVTVLVVNNVRMPIIARWRSPMSPSEHVDSATEESLVEETLVEEVSIDGMCGVY
jgi:mycofactocin precursor